MAESDADYINHWEKELPTFSKNEGARLFALARRAARLDGTVVMPVEDYHRLIEAAECDDRLEWCETCGAWLDHDDPALASTEDYRGCWKVAAGEEEKPDNCRSYRAFPLPTPPNPEKGQCE